MLHSSIMFYFLKTKQTRKPEAEGIKLSSFWVVSVLILFVILPSVIPLMYFLNLNFE